MTVVLYLLFGSLVLGGAGLGVFLWSLRSGQYEDLGGRPTASCSMMTGRSGRPLP